ncbi:uncharacterized protein LOC105275530 isoform X2 [Ooceraea biroi]|uniref:uncharacterized protein LOC105275530 isoform X2 n=1 Tax=Ooceraea biroi TaxID=2015173 RepID=UPI000F0853D1|nr:uncharacterized protein LOC105275530 isoform X2 [Ooceraea biroi]
MADDPNRDILPVKEVSCSDTISAIDLRERHLVCKLDRYELEDKYLRLLDEANNLKKLSNCQEDKIKRLGTKLIRLASNPRSCGLALDVADDRTRMATLEFENAKLKEKIVVMRNQLLSHTMSGRSTSRSRNNLARPTSSGLITCRSENNRANAPSCQCIVAAGDNDDNDVRNYLVKIEKLEAQKKDMTCRIAELEKELAATTDSQREKVAENVEYIRVWRQMKQLNDKLTTAQEKNGALTAEINDLKTTLKQTTRNNQEIAAVLTSERSRMVEIDEQLVKAKNSQFTVREKDEQIRDLASELKIMQQHNNELIALTSKYGQVEVENIELRKKLSEHVQEQQTLKTAFNNEQANIATLQTTNEQLLAKLAELQANIDTLTVQLRSLHKQNERRDATPSKRFTEQSVAVEQCKKCCEMYDRIMQLEEKTAGKSHHSVDKSVQTTIVTTVSTREQSTMINVENEEKARLHSPLKEWKKVQEANGTSILSREKILKLLDQAQINTPLDASRITPGKEEYAGILDASQRHSCQEISSLMLRDESNPVEPSSRKGLANLENPNVTLSQILLVLFDALQEYMSLNNAGDRVLLNQQVYVDSLIDVNNNNLITTTVRGIKQNYFSTENVNNCAKDCMTGAGSYVHESVQTSDCICSNVKDCYASLKPDRRCCTVCTPRSVAVCTKDCKNLACKEVPAISMKDISSAMKDTLDTTLFPKVYDKCRKSSYRDISNDFCVKRAIKKMKTFKSPCYPKCNLTCHLRKAKDPISMQEKQKLPCKIECLSDSIKLAECPAESFPLLISDKQGLIEIHISRLQLFTSIAKIPEEEDICSLSIYISWDIWGEKTAYTPRMKCPDLAFNSSSVYRIADLFYFFKNVLSEYLIFRVNIVRQNDTSRTLARAKVSIKDILDYPQNKLHYIVPVNSVIACFFGVNFGQLSLWVRLSCNVDMVEAFKRQCGITSLRDITHALAEKKDTYDIPQKSPPRDSPTFITTIVSEDRDSKDTPVPSLDSNFQSGIVNSDDDHYYTDSNNEGFSSRFNDTNDMFAENEIIKSPDSETLTDDANEENDNNVIEDSSSMAEFKSLLVNKLEEDTIIIEIVSISLLEESSIIEDDEVHLLYVEYSFLGHRGEDMETISVQKPQIANQEMFYNFKRKFQIDEQTHPMERETLRTMLAKSVNPNIKFIIISEPLPEETEIKECEDIGYATFNIKKYALSNGRKDILLPIKDNRNEQIGVLKITVLGLDTIRKCLPNVKSYRS